MLPRTAFILLLTIICFGGLSAQHADHWESLIYASDSWRYYVNTGTYPDGGWYQPDFDDSLWQSGFGGFGYADGDDNTSIANPPYPESVHVRIAFTIADTSQILAAVLNMDYDDGFVAWINGTEIARSNLGGAGEDPALTQPSIDHEAIMYQGQAPSAFVISHAKLSTCLRTGVNILAVQVNNFGTASSDLSCIPYLSAGLKTNQVLYRPVPSWFSAPYTGFTGSELPLVVVRTNGVEIPSENKALVDFGIIDNGPGNLNFPEDVWNAYHGKAGIEYRGSSSMMFPKKNFGLETRTLSGSDSAVSLLGLPVEADWVMHGPYSDKSLVRNRLAYDLARKMGHYAPRARFCEMFIDERYQGVYVLLEKIKRDSNRVNIAVLDSTDVDGYDLTGGYIVKIDRSADGSYLDGWFSTHPGSGAAGTGPFFAWHYPKWENILPVQMNYIKKRITRFEDALFSADYLDPYTGYRSFIDINSFIDYFLLVELSKNTDGYRLSTFLYKDRDDRDSRIHMGPVWDYDLAFGNADYYESSFISGWNYTVTADGWGTPYWWSRFISDPYFINNLKCRWKQFRQDFLSDESITETIDAYADTIRDASIRNFVQWPIHGMYVWPNAFVGNTYQEDLSYMKTWIIARMVWLDNNMPGLCTVSDNQNISEASFFAIAHPNPSIGQINLEIQNPDRLSLRLDVVNISGNVVFSDDLGNQSLSNRSVSMHPGLYLVKISDGIRFSLLKVIVQ